MELWVDECSECKLESRIRLSDRSCDRRLCWSHCVHLAEVAGSFCSSCQPTGDPASEKRRKVAFGVADVGLDGVEVFRLVTKGDEPGGFTMRSLLEKEICLWSDQQLECLAKYVRKAFCGMLFDADEASEWVQGKTSTQCARLVHLLDMALPKVLSGANEEDLDENKVQVSEAEEDDQGQEGEEANEDHELRQEEGLHRRAVLFLKASLSQYLADLIREMFPMKRKSVTRAVVQRAVEQQRRKRH